jgi:hypothetical protein
MEIHNIINYVSHFGNLPLRHLYYLSICNKNIRNSMLYIIKDLQERYRSGVLILPPGKPLFIKPERSISLTRAKRMFLLK